MCSRSSLIYMHISGDTQLAQILAGSYRIRRAILNLAQVFYTSRNSCICQEQTECTGRRETAVAAWMDAGHGTEGVKREITH